MCHTRIRTWPYFSLEPHVKFLVCNSQGQEFGQTCRTAAPTSVCFCISTWPVTGLHHCCGWWKIQNEAVWVSCMIKMFFSGSSTLLSGRHLVSSASLWSTYIHLRCHLWINQLQTSASPLPFTIGGMYLVVCSIWNSWCAAHRGRNLSRLVWLLLLPSCIQVQAKLGEVMEDTGFSEESKCGHSALLRLAFLCPVAWSIQQFW